MYNLNIKKSFIAFVEWDKKLIKKFQDKYNLSDYQINCLAFAKGFIIGAILL
ncbi:hypothetical protein CPYG_00186 [Cyanophage P-SS1]|uniref:Uncharacterized protein n=1 Tax=Cyanophage P-SS1 TaxID=889957 RepID=M1PKK3_9CAUD|nr:hypothetical protein CPYG_00186 [Cyanophage P-SS1]